MKVFDIIGSPSALTVEQGKTLNEELKHNVCNNFESLLDKIETMSDKEISKIKEKIAEVEKNNDKKGKKK